MSVSSNVATGAVDVTDEATEIRPGRSMRKSLTVRVVTGSVEIGGGSDLVFGEGIPLATDEVYVFDDYNGAVFAICNTAGTAEVRFMEVGG